MMPPGPAELGHPEPIDSRPARSWRRANRSSTGPLSAFIRDYTTEFVLGQGSWRCSDGGGLVARIARTESPTRSNGEDRRCHEKWVGRSAVVRSPGQRAPF